MIQIIAISKKRIPFFCIMASSWMMVPGTVSWDAPSHFIEAWRPSDRYGGGVFPQATRVFKMDGKWLFVAISYVKIWGIIQLKQQLRNRLGFQVSVYMEIKDHIKKSPLELLMN